VRLEIATNTYKLMVVGIGCAMVAVLVYASWLSIEAGRQTPGFWFENGLMMSPHDLRRVSQIDEIELDRSFFYLIPEFGRLQEQRAYLDAHRAVWDRLMQTDTHTLVIADQRFVVESRQPSVTTVLAKYGAMFAVATFFAMAALVALWRHGNAAGRAAALFLFGASLYTLSLPALVTRGLSLPHELFESMLDFYTVGSVAFVGLIYFPFVFNSGDLRKWVIQFLFWFLFLRSVFFLWQYFSDNVAIGGGNWFTILCVVLFVGRVVQRCCSQTNVRSVTHLALCYTALVLPTLTFMALLLRPDLLAMEISSLQYFVLTSTVVPIAMISLLESELLEERNLAQAKLIDEQSAESERLSQQARQTVVMNLHDHVARSLDSISALALRARLAGEGQSLLIQIRDLAKHAHRALRGLFSISDENCKSWEELRIHLREYGNALVENDAVDFQLLEWPLNDSDVLLGADVKLVCFHVVSEAITNAVKHAKANQISVELGAELEEFRVMVQDDGVGFDAAGVDKTQHHGLEIMRKRAQLVGGRVEIQSVLGKGTRLVLTGPLRVPSGFLPEMQRHSTSGKLLKTSHSNS